MKYFVELGFSPHDKPPSPAEVKKRWKELCRKHHPDLGGDEKEFMRVMHAYEMLTNPEYRHKHIIEEAKRKNHNSFGDLNIRVHVPVAFDMAFFGQRVVVSYNRIEFDENLKPVTDKPFDVVAETVDLPPGSVGGFEHIIAGGGHKMKESFGQAIVVFTPMPHAKFAVQGADVVSREAIPLETLLKGGKVDVMTMYGVQTLRVPPGTKPGTELSIKRCGVMKQGRHVVRAEALFPSQEELKTKEAWQGLGIDWAEAEEEDKEADDMRAVFAKLGGGRHIVFQFGR